MARLKDPWIVVGVLLVLLTIGIGLYSQTRTPTCEEWLRPARSFIARGQPSSADEVEAWYRDFALLMTSRPEGCAREFPQGY